MNATQPALHNPDNLTPEQYGASEGWRLLYVGENIPSDAQWSDRWQRGGWSPALSIGQSVEKTDGVAWRTRTPDPYADKPADGWIKMIERKPTEADLPVWAWSQDHAGCRPWVINTHEPDYAEMGSFSHWKPAAADIPAPPLRELTQAKQINAAYHEWLRERNNDGAGTLFAHEAGAKWGIAYERAEIAKMIEDGRDSNGSADEVMVVIEARVKGTHD